MSAEVNPFFARPSLDDQIESIVTGLDVDSRHDQRQDIFAFCDGDGSAPIYVSMREGSLVYVGGRPASHYLNYVKRSIDEIEFICGGCGWSGKPSNVTFDRPLYCLRCGSFENVKGAKP